MSRYVELAEKATPLPWAYKFGLLNGQGGLRLRQPADAAFIVALVNDAPAIERLWKAAEDVCMKCASEYRDEKGDRPCERGQRCSNTPVLAAVESLRSLFGEEQK